MVSQITEKMNRELTADGIFLATDSMSMMSAVKALGSAVQPQSTVDFGLSFWWSTVYWPARPTDQDG